MASKIVFKDEFNFFLNAVVEEDMYSSQFDEESSSLALVLSILKGHKLLSCHNILFPETDQFYVGGKRCVGKSNQDVYIWGVESDVVYQAQDGESVDWQIHSDLDDFIISFLYWNAANGGASSMAIVNGSLSPAAKLVWDSAKLKVWRESDCSLVKIDNSLIAFGPHDQPIKAIIAKNEYRVIDSTFDY